MEKVIWGDESGIGVCFGLIFFGVFCRGEGIRIGDVEWNNFRFLGGNGCFVAAAAAKTCKGDVVEGGCWSGLVSRGVRFKWKSFVVDAGSEDRILVINWDHDGFMVDIDGVKSFSWSPSSPVVRDVKVSTSDKCSKEVEIIVVSVHANENNPIVGAKGEDGGSGES